MHDIVIIGAGLGGLVCAHVLSKRGLKVLVLERQSAPGGCMQSYRRGGYRFDTGLHYVGGIARGQSLHAAFSSLGLLRLPWHRLDSSGFDLVTIGTETFPFAEGFDGFEATLRHFFPHEKVALRQYTRMMQQMDDDSNMRVSAWQYLHETFHDELLINVLSGTSLKQELRRDTLPLFSFAHMNAPFIESSWRLGGDGGMLVSLLTHDISRHGGEVLCGAEVVELVEHDGLIVGARLSDGTTFEGKYFIADLHPAVMLALLKDENSKIRKVYRRRVGLLENTFGMFTASLLLKPGTIRYFNHNKYVYSRSDVWSLHERESVSGDVGGVMISCRVPEDGSSWAQQIDLLTPMPWSLLQPFASTSPGRRGEAYLGMKRRLSEACISLSERVLPGLGGAVSQCFTSTPLTYRDYNYTPRGSAFGIRKDYTQPLQTILSPQTPISNLLLTGQNVALHGVQGVIMTAQETCKRIIH